MYVVTVTDTLYVSVGFLVRFFYEYFQGDYMKIFGGTILKLLFSAFILLLLGFWFYYAAHENPYYSGVLEPLVEFFRVVFDAVIIFSVSPFSQSSNLKG